MCAQTCAFSVQVATSLNMIIHLMDITQLIIHVDHFDIVKYCALISDHFDKIKEAIGVDYIGMGSDYDGVPVWVNLWKYHWNISIWNINNISVNWHTMMTSSNGNIFRVTGHLCGEFNCPRSPHKGHKGALMFSLICTRINGWVNNDDAGDLRRHHAHYEVTLMLCQNRSGLTQDGMCTGIKATCKLTHVISLITPRNWMLVCFSIQYISTQLNWTPKRF